MEVEAMNLCVWLSLMLRVSTVKLLVQFMEMCSCVNENSSYVEPIFGVLIFTFFGSSRLPRHFFLRFIFLILLVSPMSLS